MIMRTNYLSNSIGDNLCFWFGTLQQCCDSVFSNVTCAYKYIATGSGNDGLYDSNTQIPMCVKFISDINAVISDCTSLL